MVMIGNYLDCIGYKSNKVIKVLIEGGGLMVGGLINTGNPHLEENLLYILISIGVGLFSLGAMFLIVMEYSYRS